MKYFTRYFKYHFRCLMHQYVKRIRKKENAANNFMPVEHFSTFRLFNFLAQFN